MGDDTLVPEVVGVIKRARFGVVTSGDRVSSYAVSALATIAERNPAIVDGALIAQLTHALADGGKHTQRSAAIAFGQLGEAGAVEAITTILMRHLSRLPIQARNFALISLGNLGGRATTKDTRDAVITALEKEMTEGGFTGKPFAALALGVMGRALSAAGAEPVAARMR